MILESSLARTLDELDGGADLERVVAPGDDGLPGESAAELLAEDDNPPGYCEIWSADLLDPLDMLDEIEESSALFRCRPYASRCRPTRSRNSSSAPGAFARGLLQAAHFPDLTALATPARQWRARAAIPIAWAPGPDRVRDRSAAAGARFLRAPPAAAALPPFVMQIKQITMFSMVALLSLGALPALAAETFTLPPCCPFRSPPTKASEAAQAGVDAASAAVTSARAYPNPQLEVLYGRLSPRTSGVTGGAAPTVAITQKLDYPQQRRAARRDRRAQPGGYRSWPPGVPAGRGSGGARSRPRISTYCGARWNWPRPRKT
ncbi:hypothetical protein ACU4GD_26055 [Cupriavidus basilensis]